MKVFFIFEEINPIIMAGGKKLEYVNLEYIETMSAGDEAIVKELVEVFIDQVPEFITEMKDLYEKKDWTNLGMLAHKAKSSIAIMGMDDLAAMLKEFELDAKSAKSPEKYAGYIERFIDETTHAVEELKAYFE